MLLTKTAKASPTAATLFRDVYVFVGGCLLPVYVCIGTPMRHTRSHLCRCFGAHRAAVNFSTCCGAPSLACLPCRPACLLPHCSSSSAESVICVLVLFFLCHTHSHSLKQSLTTDKCLRGEPPGTWPSALLSRVAHLLYIIFNIMCPPPFFYLASQP